MKKFNTQKKMVEVDVPVLSEDDSEEFSDAVGKDVCLFGVVYIYSGNLVGYNSDYIILKDAGIVYETGSLDSKTWKDFQPVKKAVDGEIKVRKSAIESWFIVAS